MRAQISRRDLDGAGPHDDTRAAVVQPSADMPTVSPDVAGRVVLVRRGGRPVGALVQGEDVHWVEFPRPRRGAATVLAAGAVAGLTAVGLRWATRPARIGPITMGPGGWVSVKGAKPPADPGNRPWWARLLRSYRI